MASAQAPSPKLDRFIVIHVATTCDEHGVYVTKDSAEVIELGWILLDAKTCEEVSLSKLSTALEGQKKIFFFEVVYKGWLYWGA